MLALGQSATVTFNKPGTYAYSCAPHPFMIGQVIVTGPEVASAAGAIVVQANMEKVDAGSMKMPGHAN